MNITIQSLEISGFKGIHQLSIPFNNSNAIISGSNGTGKTTVFDATLWLLFGKDSTDAKADVKPVDVNGNRVAGKDVEVSATYLINGRTVTLRKQMHEVWSKPTGGSETVYSRDETLCWINDVPMKVDRDYVPEVIKLFGGDESVFKLLSSHTAFMAQHWTDRRKTLFNLINSDVTVAGFPTIENILMGNTPEDAKKRLMEQRKRQNDTLNTIPARIDELQRSIGTVSEQELATARSEIAKLQAELESIDSQLNGSDESSRIIGETIARKATLEKRRQDSINAINNARSANIQELQSRKRSITGDIASMESSIASFNNTLSANNRSIDGLESKRVELLADYTKYQHETYVSPTDLETVCPFCNQDLPNHMVDESSKKHRDMWQASIAKKIEANISEGRGVKASIADLQTRNDKITTSIVGLQSDIVDAKEKLLAIDPLMEAAIEANNLPIVSSDIESIGAEIASVDASLSLIGTNENADSLRTRKREIAALIASHNGVVAASDANARSVYRVAELETEKSVAGSVLSSIEKDITTLGEYVSARCKLLEESINDQFTAIKWRLFDVQKNGEIRDCCDATVGGVPYGSGLNNAAEVNAGIEIIRVMSAVYGISVPCFIDNAESVNDVSSTGGQMILLSVNKAPTLTFTTLD